MATGRGVYGNGVQLGIGLQHDKSLEKSLGLGVPQNVRAIDLESLIGPSFASKNLLTRPGFSDGKAIATFFRNKTGSLFGL